MSWRQGDGPLVSFTLPEKCRYRNMKLGDVYSKTDKKKERKQIAGSYSYWCNWKYHCCDYLFQERFKSEPDEINEYFLIVLR